MLGHVDEEDAKQHAMRIQSTIEALAIKHEYSGVSDIVTVSQGICCFTPTGKEEPEEVYAMADKGLYASKKAGRNRFTFYRNSIDGFIHLNRLSPPTEAS